MKKHVILAISALFLSSLLFSSGGIFDPTQNPCDSDVVLPGCLR